MMFSSVGLIDPDEVGPAGKLLTQASRNSRTRDATIDTGREFFCHGVKVLTGRTSMLPTRAGGIFAASWMASFRSLASIR